MILTNNIKIAFIIIHRRPISIINSKPKLADGRVVVDRHNEAVENEEVTQIGSHRRDVGIFVDSGDWECGIRFACTVLVVTVFVTPEHGNYAAGTGSCVDRLDELMDGISE